MNNLVIVRDGTIGGDIEGGRTEAATKNASGNTVLILGGTIGANIVGGHIDNTGVSITGVANNNTVILAGDPTISGPGIYGGLLTGSATPNLITGNKLIFAAYSGTGTTAANPLGTIANFETYEFYLAKNVKDKDVVIYANTLNLGSGTNAAKVLVFHTPGGDAADLKVGESITLIKATTAVTGSVDPANSTIQGNQGGLLNYTLLASVVNTPGDLGLKLTVTGSSLDERSKVLSEAFYGSVGLLVESFDFAVSEAISGPNAELRVARALGTDTPTNVFGSISYGKVRHKTGSHVDVSGLSGIIGITHMVKKDSFNLTLGAFVEGGNGDYDTYNSFPLSGEFNGTGDINYGGIGFAARLDFAGGPRGNFHLELAGRFGSVKNTFKSVSINGMPVGFETKGNYYGFHAGAGYLFNFNDSYLLDVYGKYFWTRQEGDRVNLESGDVVDFDDVNSHRFRAGLRLTLNSSEKIKPYIGAAYEHEVDGKVSASAYGFKIAEPDSSGGSFVGEVGIALVPTENISLNLGVQGYAGKRQGVTGSLLFVVRF
ncbi:MAG: autotransporter outer membrane beta-barrel domain-containing protein [Deltaproteobacteria bacterium]|nr:autotransporter outer membrane beta-barrel domain-containing protein [Deltaproteobacteria bacterium]